MPAANTHIHDFDFEADDEVIEGENNNHFHSNTQDASVAVNFHYNHKMGTSTLVTAATKENIMSGIRSLFTLPDNASVCIATQNLKIVDTSALTAADFNPRFHYFVFSIEEIDKFLLERKTTLTFQSLSEKGQRRLLSALSGDRTKGVSRHPSTTELGDNPTPPATPLPETPTTFMKEFVIFQSRCPAWKKDDSRDKQFQPYLFWESEEYRGITDLLAIRRQFSGLCYMHAPTMLQRYKVAAANKKLAVGPVVTQMLNVGEYVREKLEGPALEKHLKSERSGGVSVSFLKQITQFTNDQHLASIMYTNTSETIRRSRSEEIVECLRDYGPGLISSFQVEREFGDGRLKKVSFLGDMIGPSLGHHAMLLIGYRIDQETGDHVFLLQNWWHNRYFIEVSDKYLELAHAACVFVKCELKSIPDDLPMFNTVVTYAENDVDAEEEEGYPMEIDYWTDYNGTDMDMDAELPAELKQLEKQ